jgi:hypothetical protein
MSAGAKMQRYHSQLPDYETQPSVECRSNTRYHIYAIRVKDHDDSSGTSEKEIGCGIHYQFPSIARKRIIPSLGRWLIPIAGDVQMSFYPAVFRTRFSTDRLYGERKSGCIDRNSAMVETKQPRNRSLR